MAGLRPEYFSHNEQTICLPSELTKNAREHTFTLGFTASHLLLSATKEFSETTDTVSDRDNSSRLFFPARGKNTRPFSGWSKSKKALDELSGVNEWTLHDLRRTYRSIHGKIGTPPHIAERLVNHISAQTEMERTYDRYTYLSEMHAAVEAYEQYLLQNIVG
jgi:integrase